MGSGSFPMSMCIYFDITGGIMCFDKSKIISLVFFLLEAILNG